MERTKFQSPGRGPYLRGGDNRAAGGEGPWARSGEGDTVEWRRFQPQPRASGEFCRDCQHGWPQTEFWDGLLCRVGALGKATTSLPLSPPMGSSPELGDGRRQGVQGMDSPNEGS